MRSPHARGRWRLRRHRPRAPSNRNDLSRRCRAPSCRRRHRGPSRRRRHRGQSRRRRSARSRRRRRRCRDRCSRSVPSCRRRRRRRPRPRTGSHRDLGRACRRRRRLPDRRTRSPRDPGRACRRRLPNRPKRWASASPKPAALDVDDPDAIDALGVGEPPASAIVPPMTRPPTTSSATAVSSFRMIDVIRLLLRASRSRRSRSPGHHRREGPVTGRPEGGKGLGKPQSSSDPEEPEPELSDPEPELEDPEPELEEPEPELSSDPVGRPTRGAPAVVVDRRGRRRRPTRPGRGWVRPTPIATA